MKRCPLCGHMNLRGEDRCEKCLAPLRQLDAPQPTTGLQRRLTEDEVGALPLEKAFFLSPDASLEEAVGAMRSGKVSSVLARREGELAGIVTESDLLYKLEDERADLALLPLSDVMTADVETLRSDDKVVVALNRMFAHGYRHIPVLKEKTVLGVLTVAGLFEYVSSRVNETCS